MNRGSYLVTILGLICYLLFLEQCNAAVPGVVVTNGHDCAKIGSNILAKGGKAVDAAIGALFCEGLKLPQSTGLGGGFFMTIYDAETKKASFLNARETAPAAATFDMFKGKAELAQKGILSVAVPGELRGYKEAYNKYGKGVPWKDLVQPSIDLLQKGIVVTEYFANVLNSKRDLIMKDPGLKSVYMHPTKNRPYKIGERLKNPKLVETLKVIAENDGDTIHNGPLTDIFYNEINSLGAIITKDDLINYKPTWEDPLTIKLDTDYTLYSAPLPGSGVILSYILNILNGFVKKGEDQLPQTWQKVVESFKFGYGKRTKLGDPVGENAEKINEVVKHLLSEKVATETRQKISDHINITFTDPTYYGAEYNPVNDHGTAHICVLASNGDAVSVTSTVNLIFGSGILLKETGIILNDEMDDFSSPDIINDESLPPSEANYIEPGKRPMSSMVPSILVNGNGDVEMVVGGAGGTKITTSVALTILKYLTFDYDLVKAVNDKRAHHQLFPMLLELEEAYCEEPTDIHDYLCNEIGHNCTCDITDGFSAVTAIAKKGNHIVPVFDSRRQGEIAYTGGSLRAAEPCTILRISLVLAVILYKYL